jgi:hypothetical protein
MARFVGVGRVDSVVKTSLQIGQEKAERCVKSPHLVIHGRIKLHRIKHAIVRIIDLPFRRLHLFGDVQVVGNHPHGPSTYDTSFSSSCISSSNDKCGPPFSFSLLHERPRVEIQTATVHIRRHLIEHR